MTTWTRILILVSVLQGAYEATARRDDVIRSRQKERFLLAMMIRIDNSPCKASDGENGTCQTRNSCLRAGGTIEGTCARGFGVCCQTRATCSSTVIMNSTTFINPGYPHGFSPRVPDYCQIRIRKSHVTCQVRLDFEVFMVGGPSMEMNQEGQCLQDRLTISGADGTAVPTLCGNLSGQHLYVDYGTSDTVTLNVILDPNQAMERTWKVLMTLVECNSLTRAPDGCLQFFTGPTGQVQIFNHDSYPHLANLAYGICVRKEAGMNIIQWAECSSGDFFISGMPCSTPTPKVQTEGCTEDYVIIPQGTWERTPPSSSDRFCGADLGGAPIATMSAPFMIRVRTDDQEMEDEGNTGFCFKWNQSP